MKATKRFLCGLMAFVLLLSVLPGTVSAKAFFPGDADGDGVPTYNDALLILRIAVGADPADENILASCDTNRNGMLDYEDALTVLRVSVGLDEMPPMEPPKDTVVEFDGDFTYSDRVYTMAECWNPHAYLDNDHGYLPEYLTSDLYRFVFNDEHNAIVGENPFSGYAIIPEMAAAMPVDVTKTVKAARPEFGIPKDATEGYAYEIALNPDACWEDGTPITADDYVESMKRLLDPKLQNYQASNFYNDVLSVAGAESYAMSGQTVMVDIGLTGAYIVDDLIKGDDGVYRTPNGEDVFIAVYYPLEWTAGNSLGDYVDAYGEEYFDTTNWRALVALCDDEGKVPCTDEALALLSSVTTGNPAWGETDDDLFNYLLYSKTYPEFDFSGVGLYKSGDYEITLVLTRALEGFDLLYQLSGNWLVKTDLYDHCLRQEGGVWISTYGTSVGTTISYGPYKMTSYKAGSEMHFVRNESWFGYSDGKHVYVDPKDGLTYPMYQTTEIDCQVVPDSDRAMLLFLRGQSTAFELNAGRVNDFRDSAYCYYTPSETVFSLILNGHVGAIKSREIAEGFDRATRDLEMLTNTAFRRAIGLSYDRDDFAATVSPDNFAALGLIGDTFVHNSDAGTRYRDTPQAKQTLCDFYGVDVSKFPSLDAAAASISGYDPQQAKACFKQAYMEGLAAGYISDVNADGICDQNIIIEYARSSGMTDFMSKMLNYLNENLAEVTDGTPFEGKIRFESPVSYNSDWVTVIREGRADTVLAGWSGSALNPFGLTELYANPDRQYDAAWFDATEAEMTVNVPVNGINTDVTLSLKQWSDTLNGTTVTVNGVSYNFGSGYNDVEVRLRILAAFEGKILSTYNYLPMLQDGSMHLLSQRAQYVVDAYNPVMGWGDLAYLRYQYNDVQWQKYLDQNGGMLEY